VDQAVRAGAIPRPVLWPRCRPLPAWRPSSAPRQPRNRWRKTDRAAASATGRARRPATAAAPRSGGIMISNSRSRAESGSSAGPSRATRSSMCWQHQPQCGKRRRRQALDGNAVQSLPACSASAVSTRQPPSSSARRMASITRFWLRTGVHADLPGHCPPETASSLPRQFARAARGFGDGLVEQRLDAFIRHQHLQRLGGGAAGW